MTHRGVHEPDDGASWFTGERRHISTGFDDRQTAGSRRLCAAVAHHLSPDAGNILDIGCGGGEILQLALALWPNARFVGIDPEPEALARAKHRLQESRVRLISASAETLDSAVDVEEAFDLIICHLNLALWDSPEDGLAQAAARLAPGGVLYVVDLSRPSDAELRELLSLTESEEEREYLTVQAETSMTLEDAEQLARGVVGTCPHPLHLRVARGGLAGYSFDSAEAAELWSDPHIRDAVAALEDSSQKTPSADPVLYWEFRRHG
ncbi:class I SAM-dependent methyltransferase [Nesterenkonia aerolata]|uniref:Class I SAM-dependent methyltransferase n=1 Tax=Nesterenkonia aerolata TaxID=3074079 RepID=A0ABU2DSB4_9MICC|nr:class I SAM-dependent methyltransferase [Nesterenkonia sp. LY-0111]MDR8019397.1 class I SAM-dependent methyltransferase [Nesterenkonia sp. LY-0111]